MPRPTPIRSRRPAPPRDAEQPTMTPERRAWLSGWKERAVKALPTMVPVDAKVATRQAVETALAAYGPEDPVAELQDLVTTVVDEIMGQWTAKTRSQEREARKEQLLQAADFWIDDIMLRRLPIDIVGKPGSGERRAVLATLRQRVRTRFEAELAGDETVDVIVDRIREELATWAVEQNPKIDRRTVLIRLLPWAVTTLAGGIAAVALSPELKAAAHTGVRVLKERLSPYKPVAAQLLVSGLEQVERWANARAKKKDPS